MPRWTVENAEEKFTKFSGKRRDAREILCNTTSFWTNFDKDWYEIAGGDAAGFLNFGPEVEIRISNLDFDILIPKSTSKIQNRTPEIRSHYSSRI